MLSSNKEVSSKRVIGTLCIALYIFFLVGSFLGISISGVQATLMNGLLYVGGGLLGVGVFEGFGAYYGGYNSYNNDNPNNITGG